MEYAYRAYQSADNVQGRLYTNNTRVDDVVTRAALSYKGTYKFMDAWHATRWC